MLPQATKQCTGLFSTPLLISSAAPCSAGSAAAAGYPCWPAAPSPRSLVARVDRRAATLAVPDLAARTSSVLASRVLALVRTVPILARMALALGRMVLLPAAPAVPASAPSEPAVPAATRRGTPR